MKTTEFKSHVGSLEPVFNIFRYRLNEWYQGMATETELREALLAVSIHANYLMSLIDQD